MNILSIKTNIYPVFKSYQYQDDGVIGFDDAISQDKRNYIRSHYAEWYMPYSSIYDNEHRLTDYQMRLIISDLEKNHEMQKIYGTNIHRGQTLVDKPEYLQALKKKGINTVVDLVGYGKTYEEAIKKAGLNYFVYNIFENWWNMPNIDKQYSEKLVKFIKKMQEDNIYIGCQHGSNDTDIAFILNDFFNPLLEGKAKTKITPNDSDFPIRLNTTYDSLTKEDKKLLGWTKEFEQRLIKKLISI